LSVRIVNRLLAAACIAATLGLAACDAAVETAREAQRDADQAARIAASAGQPRATDNLLDKVASTPLADRDTLAKSLGTDYVKQEPAEKDLARAADLINQALKSDLADSVKASLQAEAAHIALTHAGEQYNGLRGRLEDISRRVLTLQSFAQLAVEMGSEANAISASVKPPTTEEVDKAKQALSAAQAAVQKAEAEVKRFQDEINSKQEQARGIYSRTQAAFQQADALKGKEAIDAGNKAIEESKQGDALMAEAGNLEPKLAQARTALATAQIGQKDAERQVATATAAYEAGNTWVKQNTDRINALRDGAKKIVSGENGVAAQYAQLLKIAGELEPLIKDAYTTAEAARSQYGNARSLNDRVLGEVASKASERGLESSDPLIKLARDPRASALLSWGQAAAAEQAGRIQSAGYQAATLVGGVKTAVDKAHQAAGMPATAASPLNAAEYQKNAAASFTAALEAAKAGNGGSGPEVDRLKWIGWSLQALANQGLAVTAPDAAQARNFASAAKEAATHATATREATEHGNPDLVPVLRRAGIDVTAG
jgi:hypothetical protein